jgi:hypothetical protein
MLLEWMAKGQQRSYWKANKNEGEKRNIQIKVDEWC